MELDILKYFIKFDVEVLIGGVWIEGHMTSIAKGVVILMPLDEAKEFYGPASFKAESIIAIRQVKRGNANIPNVVINPPAPVVIKSSFEAVPPNFRFAFKKEGQL